MTSTRSWTSAARAATPDSARGRAAGIALSSCNPISSCSTVIAHGNRLRPRRAPAGRREHRGCRCARSPGSISRWTLRVAVVQHRDELGQRFVTAEYAQQVDGGCGGRPEFDELFSCSTALAAGGTEAKQDFAKAGGWRGCCLRRDRAFGQRAGPRWDRSSCRAGAARAKPLSSTFRSCGTMLRTSGPRGQPLDLPPLPPRCQRFAVLQRKSPGPAASSAPLPTRCHPGADAARPSTITISATGCQWGTSVSTCNRSSSSDTSSRRSRGNPRLSPAIPARGAGRVVPTRVSNFDRLGPGVRQFPARTRPRRKFVVGIGQQHAGRVPAISLRSDRHVRARSVAPRRRRGSSRARSFRSCSGTSASNACARPLGGAALRRDRTGQRKLAIVRSDIRIDHGRHDRRRPRLRKRHRVLVARRRDAGPSHASIISGVRPADASATVSSSRAVSAPLTVGPRPTVL